MQKGRFSFIRFMNLRRSMKVPKRPVNRIGEVQGTKTGYRTRKPWSEFLKKEVFLNIRKSFGGQGKTCKSRDVVGAMGICGWIAGFGWGAFMAAVAAYCFYRSMTAFVLFLVPACGYMWIYEKAWRRRQLFCLERQFKEAIRILAGFLSAGYSVENAVGLGCRELEQLYGPNEMIVREFAGMREQMKMNRSVEEVIRDFAERSGLEEAQRFSQIFQISKRSGGQLVPVICHTVSIMEDRSQVKEEIRTMTASVRFEQKVMSAIPFLMIIYIDWTSPGFFGVMYETILGRLIMSGCLAVYLLSCYLSGKILDIHVG